MGSMNNGNAYESRLWRLLEKDNLADLARYHQRRFFDEVPLFSRDSDIDFLPKAKKAARGILVTFALKFLQSVIAYEQHPSGYFAAITLWNLSADAFVPNLFAWCAPIRELEDKLELSLGTTPFAKETKKLVNGLRLSETFKVLEDSRTDPDSPRVFIAPAHPPYRGFAALDTFRRQTSASK